MIAPVPDEVATSVGVYGVSLTIRDVLGDHVTVCATLLMTKATSFVPSRLLLFAAAVALTVHVPEAVKVITPVLEFTVHPVVPALDTE